MKIIITFFISIVTLISLAGDKFKTLHVKDLDALLSNKQVKLFIFDANVESTRKNVGIIPGAKLLASVTDYKIETELPTDKTSKLVFYCANEQCTASHSAAERAMKAGYTDVSVMVDGIYGWRDAGKKLSKVPEGNKSSPVSLNPKEVDEMVKKNTATIVDVRESEERHDVIEGALWAPVSKLAIDKDWADFKQTISIDKTIIFHCAMGMRAKKMADRLSAEGYKTAYFKGPDQWREAGLTLKAGTIK